MSGVSRNNYLQLDSGDSDEELNQFPNAVTNLEDAAVRYSRLTHFVIGHGTTCIKTFVLQNLPKNMGTLANIIEAHRKTFIKLKYSRVINNLQFSLLFPSPNTEIIIKDIDLPLWIIIGRHVIPYALGSLPERDWKSEPQKKDLKPGHDFLRIKNIRNKISHLSKTEIDEGLYNKLWRDTTHAFMRLGSNHQDIQHYKTCDLDPEMTRKYVNEVKDQSLKDYKEYVFYLKDHNKKSIRWLVAGFGILLLAVVAVITVPLGLQLAKRASCREYKDTIYTKDAILSYIPRKGWGAKPTIKYPTNRPLAIPVNYLIVSVTGFVGSCISNDDCCSNMEILQNYNQQESHMADVAYSYVVGDDGVIYEARGLNLAPATAKGWNNDSVSLAFMGTYSHSGRPHENALEAAFGLVQYFRENKVVSNNFTIYGLCQIRKKFPNSPGPEIMKVIEKWKGDGWGWRNRSESYCAP